MQRPRPLESTCNGKYPKQLERLELVIKESLEDKDEPPGLDVTTRNQESKLLIWKLESNSYQERNRR